MLDDSAQLAAVPLSNCVKIPRYRAGNLGGMAIDKKKFARRLKSLVDESGEGQTAIGMKLTPTQSSGQMSLFTTGERVPPLPTMMALADYFDVTLDWLTCRTDDRAPPGQIDAERWRHVDDVEDAIRSGLRWYRKRHPHPDLDLVEGHIRTMLDALQLQREVADVPDHGTIEVAQQDKRALETIDED